MFRRIAIVTAIFIVVVSCFCAGALHIGYRRFTEAGPLKAPLSIIVPKGQGLYKISELLYRKGVIRNALVFRLGVRYYGKSTALKAGEFMFPVMASAKDAMNVLVKGETVSHRITIAEGLTVKQIMAVISENEVLEGDIESLPEEGALLPETYLFSRGDTKQQIIKRMISSMEKILEEKWKKRADNLPLKNMEEAVVLASIVERETAIPEERGRIASVFVNRLVKRMRLQSDPTVIYGLSDGLGVLDKPLSKKNLKTDTPYNTYTNYGLPPSPICNPGKDAISAVLNPDETDYLYFVADGSGGHVFSKTLEEHNRNVKKWRRIEREMKK